LGEYSRSGSSRFHNWPLMGSTVHADRRSAAIVRAVIALSHALGLKLVAEGVETVDQLEFLSAEGVAEIQGYLIGRPQPVEAFGDIVGELMPNGTGVVAAARPRPP
jgi:predicted signal transduction protein with EAL and GGDEF domain